MPQTYLGGMAQPAQGSLFGAPQQQQPNAYLGAQQQPQGGGLFGQQPQPGALFAQPAAGGLFGAPQQPQQQAGGLFAQPQAGGLFGAQPQVQQSGGLFGAPVGQPAGLIGGWPAGWDVLNSHEDVVDRSKKTTTRVPMRYHTPLAEPVFADIPLPLELFNWEQRKLRLMEMPPQPGTREAAIRDALAALPNETSYLKTILDAGIAQRKQMPANWPAGAVVGAPQAAAGQQQVGGGLFGAAPQPQAGGLFGAQPQQQQPGAGSLFGAQPAAGAGLFGAAQPAQQQTLFGAQPAAGAGLFATQPQQPAAGGLFGAQPAAAGGLFGAQPAQPQPLFGAQPAGGLFGAQQPAQQQQAAGGLFGGIAAKPAGGGLFGAQPAQPAAGIFGQPAQQQAAPGGLFGGQAAAPNVFGAQPGAAAGGLFGAQPAAAPNMFGVQQQQPAAGGGLFGAAAPQGTGLFGAPAAGHPQQAFGAFGAAAPAVAGPVTISASTAAALLPADANIHVIIEESVRMRRPAGGLPGDVAAAPPATGGPGPAVAAAGGASGADPKGFYMALNVNLRAPLAGAAAVRSVANVDASATMPSSVTARGARCTLGAVGGAVAGTAGAAQAGSPALGGPRGRTSGAGAAAAAALITRGSAGVTADPCGDGVVDVAVSMAAGGAAADGPAVGGTTRCRQCGAARCADPSACVAGVARTAAANARRAADVSSSVSQRAEPQRHRVGGYTLVVPVGWSVSPPLAALSRMTDDELRAVHGFEVRREGFGSVSFEQPADLTHLPEGVEGRVLDDGTLEVAIGELVGIDELAVSIYPSALDVPPVGVGLNCPATAVMFNVSEEIRAVRLCANSISVTLFNIHRPNPTYPFIWYPHPLQKALEAGFGHELFYDPATQDLGLYFNHW